MKIGFKINLDSHNIIHFSSILPFIPCYMDVAIGRRYVYEILEEMANNYAILIKQKKIKHHTPFSAAFYKNEEEDQRSNENVYYSYLKKISKFNRL